MYTVVNSRAYEEENLNPGMDNWVKGAIAIDVIIGILLVVLEILAIKKYFDRKKAA